jgi:hypothetical protein
VSKPGVKTYSTSPMNGEPTLNITNMWTIHSFEVMSDNYKTGLIVRSNHQTTKSYGVEVELHAFLTSVCVCVGFTCGL